MQSLSQMRAPPLPHAPPDPCCYPALSTPLHRQVMGFAQEYQGGLTFATLLDAGHSVPWFKPARAQYFVGSWVGRVANSTAAPAAPAAAPLAAAPAAAPVAAPVASPPPAKRAANPDKAAGAPAGAPRPKGKAPVKP